MTGRQRWAIAGLLLLQVPFSLLFYPVAALFALTGIGVPVSIVCLQVGTMPYASASKRKAAWRSRGARAVAEHRPSGDVAAA